MLWGRLLAAQYYAYVFVGSTFRDISLRSSSLAVSKRWWLVHNVIFAHLDFESSINIRDQLVRLVIIENENTITEFPKPQTRGSPKLLTLNLNNPKP